MQLQLRGSLNHIKSRVTASGDEVNVISVEVFGDIRSLHDLLKKPLLIDLREWRAGKKEGEEMKPSPTTEG